MFPFYIEIPLLLILFFLSGFFSGSETALFSLSKIQIEKLVQTHPKKGQKIRNLLEQPRRLIITILLGNEFVNIAISSISAGIVIQIIGQKIPWINILIVLPLLLLFGEITPKTIAIKNNERFSTFIISPLIYFTHWITPLRWFIRNISDRVVNLFVKESARKGSLLTEDVIKTIIEDGEKEGILDSIEKEFIYNIFDFGDARVDEVMTPRANLFYLPAEMPLQEMIQQIKEKHYSKVPIYKENRDDIIGILFATDLIGLTPEEIIDSETTLRRISRKPYFIPSTKRADELFKTFQRKKISIAIVLDEYGGVLGLVTMEDLLEEIFGEISDEYEKEDKQHEEISEHLYRVKASMPIEEFNELIGSELSSDEVDTIGGLIFSLFGELPKVKSTLIYNNLHFTVDKIVGNRIESIIVKKI